MFLFATQRGLFLQGFTAHAPKQAENGVLLLRRIDEKHWECLVKPGRRAKVGLTFKISDELSATVTEMREDGNRIIRLNYDGILKKFSIERARCRFRRTLRKD